MDQSLVAECMKPESFFAVIHFGLRLWMDPIFIN